MTVPSVSSNYTVYQKPGYSKKWTASKRSDAVTGGVSQTVSLKGNTCTDGVDDGKVGLFSAVGNILQGAGKAVVNGVKGMFTDKEGKFSLFKTIKSAAMIGLCCVCPAAGAVLAGVGLVSGAVKLGSGVVRALNANTDAEAKDMWEQVGEGGLTVAASVAGMKASIGAMKAAAGESSALASLKPNASFLEKASAFGKDAVASTKNNLTIVKGSFSNFFKQTKEVGQARSAVRSAKAALKKTTESDTAALEQAQTDLSYAEYNLANAKEAWSNTSIGRVATDAKNVVFHPIKAFKALKKSLNTDSATAEAVSGASKYKFGDLTRSLKNAPSNLSATAKQIWTKLSDPNTTYSQLVSQYGYNNVAEVLEIMTEYGIIDSQM